MCGIESLFAICQSLQEIELGRCEIVYLLLIEYLVLHYKSPFGFADLLWAHLFIGVLPKL